VTHHLDAQARSSRPFPPQRRLTLALRGWLLLARLSLVLEVTAARFRPERRP
jgi:hypothetical protein